MSGWLVVLVVILVASPVFVVLVVVPVVFVVIVVMVWSLLLLLLLLLFGTHCILVVLLYIPKVLLAREPRWIQAVSNIIPRQVSSLAAIYALLAGSALVGTYWAYRTVTLH